MDCARGAVMGGAGARPVGVELWARAIVSEASSVTFAMSSATFEASKVAFAMSSATFEASKVTFAMSNATFEASSAKFEASKVTFAMSNATFEASSVTFAISNVTFDECYADAHRPCAAVKTDFAGFVTDNGEDVGGGRGKQQSSKPQRSK